VSLVVVGSVGLDDIQTPLGSVQSALGGSAVYASMAARNFTTPHIIGVVGSDFPSQHIQMLNSHGINLEGFQVKEGSTFRWSGKYEDLNHAISLLTDLGVFGEFDPLIPQNCLCCRSLLLGNIHPALQLKVLQQINSYHFVGCDTMNYWITGEKHLLAEVLKKVDIIFMNEAEVKQFTGQKDIFGAAEDLLKLGAKIIVVKRGEYGAVAIGEDFYFFAPAYPVRKVIDPTGAGDCFAGGFMGYLATQDQLCRQTVKNAVLYGTVMAAINVSAFSIKNLIGIDRELVDANYNQLLSWI